MAKLKIKTGQIILVSSSDLALVKAHEWYMSSHPYARATINGQRIALHRFLMRPPDGLVVDHLNGKPADNRRENLRICTYHQNAQNMRTKKGKYQGVFFDSSMKRRRRWMARIEISGRAFTLGRFKTKEDAAAAYRAKKSQVMGQGSLPFINFKLKE